MVQRFNVRRGRAAAPYRDNIAEIKTVTQSRLYPALKTAGLTLPDNDYPNTLRNDGFCLEEIPDFCGLLPCAYDAGVPVFALCDNELNATGIVQDNMIAKRAQIHTQLTNVADTLQDLMS
ncbi:hypothetical protein EO087_03455 [Dyella sp. M7H15-1]|uniref:hypothetical protein n=1 Tax=Dyella sp. M7H15-1 TaxID=2501295 RepID=UPI0010050C37|nr:hypothetical protein [Dyella sp. M7H15-1]QAU23162.1 hypothetical protein EO087_03455 [Dyella sp. M7H15-1]